MPQRLLTFKGSITEPSLTQSLLNSNSEAKANYIYQRLSYNGIGTRAVALDTSIQTASNWFYLTFNCTIQIFAPLTENPNRALQLITNVLNEIGYKNINLSLAGDDLINENGTITPFYNDSGASYNQNNDTDLSSILGFSTGAALAVGLIIFILIKK
jgi:hypothetical protein